MDFIFASISESTSPPKSMFMSAERSCCSGDALVTLPS